MDAKHRIKYFFFPPSCVCCGELIDLSRCAEIPVFCKRCEERWQKLTLEPCGCCGDFISSCTYLPRGMKKPGYFGHIKLTYYRPGKAESAASRLIYAMKHKCEDRFYDFAADALTVKLSAFLRDMRILPSDCIFAYVPRKRASVVKNGADQAKELAVRIADACEAECPKGLIRRRGGREQKKLHARERFSNARKITSVSPKLAWKIKDKYAVIVDDLLTTGASVSAVADLMLKNGAKGVIFVTLAVTE